MQAAEARKAGRPSRRDDVLSTALRLYGTNGVLNVTPTDLARALAMTATAIRYHFATTDELLHALADGFLDELEGALAEHPADPLWSEGVEGLMTDFVTVVLAHRDIAVLVRRDTYVANHEAFGGRLERATQRLRRAITGPEPTEAATVAAIAATGGLWRPIEILPAEDVVNHLDSIVRVILSGHPRHEPATTRRQRPPRAHERTRPSRGGAAGWNTYD
jgi:AcrR family transcriptional regulator